jgi:hypothetical protein
MFLMYFLLEYLDKKITKINDIIPLNPKVKLALWNVLFNFKDNFTETSLLEVKSTDISIQILIRLLQERLDF